MINLLPNYEKKVLCETLETDSIVQQLSQKLFRASQVYWLLKGVSSEAIFYYYILSQRVGRRRIKYFLRAASKIKLAIDGHDLKNIGVDSNAMMGKILNAILSLKWDGKIKIKKQELAFARRILKEREEYGTH